MLTRPQALSASAVSMHAAWSAMCALPIVSPHLYTSHACTHSTRMTRAQVPVGYRFSGAPLQLESQVVTGFGRGSRQLGVPTANMDPGPLQQQLEQLPRGVYFGWAQLDPPGGWPAADGAVHKMVMNVGRRPTVNTGKG